MRMFDSPLHSSCDACQHSFHVVNTLVLSESDLSRVCVQVMSEL